MKKSIKERIILIAACGMALSAPVISPAGIASAAVPAPVAAAAAASSEKQAASLLITDEAKFFPASDIESLRDEQLRIHQKGDVAVNYKFYTYVYNDGRNAKEHAQQLADEFKYEGGDIPFIFVLDTKGHTYHFVEDIRLTPYTPAAYLASLADHLLSKEMTANHAKEFIIRADSILTMNVDGDFAYTGQMKGNDAAMKSFVITKDFDSASQARSRAAQPENCVTNDCVPAVADKEDSSNKGLLAAALALVAAVGTIAAFAIRRKKQNGAWKR